jgi:tubulin polyglutamylase TTLL6/13
MHLRRFKKEFPDHYNFFPQTWIYPADTHEISEYNNKKYRKRAEEIAAGVMTQEQSDLDPPVMFIVKPEAGCQGKGIFIARKLEEMQFKISKKFTLKKQEFEEQLR